MHCYVVLSNHVIFVCGFLFTAGSTGAIYLLVFSMYMLKRLRVMYRKYSTRGGVEWQIQHEAKPSAVFAQDPTPSTVFFRTSRVNGALTDLLFCVGRISSCSSDGSRRICISK